MKPLFGPSAKISGGSFVSANPRQPLASAVSKANLGEAFAYLWHTDSFGVGFFSNLSSSQWGVSGRLARLPKSLVLAASPSVYTSGGLTDLINAMTTLDVALALLATPSGTFQPLTAGAPVTGEEAGGVAERGGLSPIILDNSLFRGGKMLVATVTTCRVAWVSTNSGSLRSDDYVKVNDVADYDVWTDDAADHLLKLQTALEKFDDFRGIFYQAAAEIDFGGGVTTAQVPDSAMNALIAGEPRLSRQSYTLGDFDGVVASIIAEAEDFFS